MNIKGRITAVLAATTLIVGVGATAVSAAPAPTTPDTVGVYAPKGNPGMRVPTTKVAPKSNPTATTLMAPGDSLYRYAGGRQYDIDADGVFANIKVEQPFLDTSEFHSLAEIAVQKDIGGQRQIVEVGWNIDRIVNGDADPHLFVYHWVNGATSCYNGCGWVDNPLVNVDAGEDISFWEGTAKKFGIQYSAGKWQIYVNNQNIGHFPESLWTTAGVTGFNEVSYTQLFGEVVGQDPYPVCSDMGTGQFASAGSGSAAYFSSVSYVNGPAVNLEIFATDATKWSAALLPSSTRSFVYGGPGATSAGASPGNIGSC